MMTVLYWIGQGLLVLLGIAVVFSFFYIGRILIALALISYFQRMTK